MSIIKQHTTDELLRMSLNEAQSFSAAEVLEIVERANHHARSSAILRTCAAASLSRKGQVENLPEPPACEYLTVKEAAALLKITEGRVRVFIRSGKLPGMKIGKQYRIRLQDLEKLKYDPTTPPRKWVRRWRPYGNG